MNPIKYFVISAFIVAATPVLAQKINPEDFHGAEATKPRYRVAYQLNSDDETKIRGTLRNIQNAMSDPRLRGKLDVELVVHGSGVEVYRINKPYEKVLQHLQKQGVILAMCENTMRGENISRDELLPFISYVPSGTGELIIREQEGWAVLHP